MKYKKTSRPSRKKSMLGSKLNRTPTSTFPEFNPKIRLLRSTTVYTTQPGHKPNCLDKYTNNPYGQHILTEYIQE